MRLLRTVSLPMFAQSGVGVNGQKSTARKGQVKDQVLLEEDELANASLALIALLAYLIAQNWGIAMEADCHLMKHS